MLAAEEFGDGATRRRVAYVFEPVDLGAVLVDPLTGLELADGLLELRDCLREQIS